MKKQTLTLYNTLSQKKEIFEANKNGTKLFVCGPTVYDYLHIGNARTFAFFDLFVRFLRNKGIKVKYLQNITDIDDKIIAKALQENSTPKEVAEKYTKIFMHDMKALHIKSVSIYAPATKFIPQIIKQVEGLIEKKHAYLIEGDGWYFDLKTFGDYGKLAKRTIEQAEDGVSRIDANEHKRNQGDFCLWKFSKSDEPTWSAPFGNGRPGWHIEDTAISEHFFGSQYDIHGGGLDLMFPHHEAEIAQEESLSGKKPFVRIWMHAGLVKVNGKKMSKSLGNFITIDEILKKTSPAVFRYIVASHHYGSPLDYTDELVRSAKESLKTITLFLLKASMVKKNKGGSVWESLEKAKRVFELALENDVNTPEALAAIFSLMHEIQPRIFDLKKSEAAKIAKWIQGSLEIFGVELDLKAPSRKVKALIKKRELFRSNKQFIQGDAVRKEIEELGYTIEDTPLGPLAVAS